MLGAALVAFGLALLIVSFPVPGAVIGVLLVGGVMMILLVSIFIIGGEQSGQRARLLASENQTPGEVGARPARREAQNSCPESGASMRKGAAFCDGC